MPRPAWHLVVATLGVASVGAGEPEPGIVPAEPPRAAQVLLASEPPDLVRELFEEGWLMLDRPGDRVQAYVVFDRPADRVYDLLSDTTRQREFRSDLESLSPAGRTPEGPIDEHHIRILFVKLSYRLRYRLDPERRRISWELDPSYPTPMARIEGQWELFEMDESHTLARFATFVDVSEALPDFLEEAATRRTLPGMLRRCRRWVNADGGKP